MGACFFCNKFSSYVSAEDNATRRGVCVHSFISYQHICFGKGHRSAALEGLKILDSVQQSQIVLSAQHQGETNQGRDVITPPGPSSTSGPFSVDVANRTYLANFTRAFWTHDRTNVAEIFLFGREMTRNYELHKIHNCTLCREVSRCELFTKIPYLPLVLEIRPITSLGHQGWRRVSWEEPKFFSFQLCSTRFSRREEKFSRRDEKLRDSSFCAKSIRYNIFTNGAP